VASEVKLIRAIWTRRLAAGAVTVAIAAGMVALSWKAGVFDDQPATRLQASCSGPWSLCSPNARWLRRVLAEAGYPDAGPGTGSALVIPSENPSSQRFFWAVGSGAPPDPGVYSPSDELPRVGDTVIYGDKVRLVWRAQGRNVYFEPLFLEPLVDRKLLIELVRLTQEVPAPEVRPRRNGPAALPMREAGRPSRRVATVLYY